MLETPSVGLTNLGWEGPAAGFPMLAVLLFYSCTTFVASAPQCAPQFGSATLAILLLSTASLGHRFLSASSFQPAQEVLRRPLALAMFASACVLVRLHAFFQRPGQQSSASWLHFCSVAALLGCGLGLAAAWVAFGRRAFERAAAAAEATARCVELLENVALDFQILTQNVGVTNEACEK